MNIIDRLLGPEHKPSTCCVAWGEHLAAWMTHDVLALDGRDAGPKPTFECPCACRKCERGKCPTAEQVGFAGMLREQRARIAAY